jgi:hypothetical protein
MSDIFKARVLELELSLDKYQSAMNKDPDYIIKCRYRFCLEIYLLNIYLLSRFENYLPRFK